MSTMQRASRFRRSGRLLTGIASGIALLLGTSGTALADDYDDDGWQRARHRGHQVEHRVIHQRDGYGHRGHRYHRHGKKRGHGKKRRVVVHHVYHQPAPVVRERVVERHVYHAPPPVVRERVVERHVYHEAPAPRPVYRGRSVRRGGPHAGGLIGAAVGGLLGSQVGSGNGKLAATAVGTIGGYILGIEVSDRY